MQFIVRVIYVVFFVVAISGCFGSSHKPITWTSSKGAVFVDASERGIFAVTHKNKNGTVISEGVCAEPSPDAIAAFAETFGLDLSVNDQGKLGFTSSSVGSAASMGLRTVSIQTLRDIMYRNCEAYALGAISEIGLETLSRRFQSTMVGIIAIEQLTGAIRAPAAVLAGSGAGSIASVADAASKTEAARADVVSATTEVDKAKTKSNAANTLLKSTEKSVTDGKKAADALIEKKAEADKIADPAEKLKKFTEKDASDLAAYLKLTNETLKTHQLAAKTASDELTAAETTKAEKEKVLAVLEQTNDAILKNAGTASTSGRIETVSAPSTRMDAATANTLSENILNIVKTVTTELNHTRDLCVSVIGRSSTEKPEEGSALAICLEKLDKGLPGFGKEIPIGPQIGANWFNQKPGSLILKKQDEIQTQEKNQELN